LHSDLENANQNAAQSHHTNTADEMADFDTIFEHLTQYRIIQCKSCKYAVVLAQIERHVKDHHPQVVLACQKTILQAAMGLPNIAHRHKDVVYPTRNDKPIPGFPVIKDSLVCIGQREGQLCKYACAAIRTMQQHCKDFHS
jgi:hypothetical protein